MGHDRDHPGGDRDQMDGRLDRLLKEYGEVEPRPGLEDRIFARVRTEAAPNRWLLRWAWSLAGAATAVLLIVMWSGIARRPLRSPQDTGRASEAKNSAQAPAVIGANVPSASHPRTLRVHRAVASLARRREPRLDRFPSPRPLSHQELALVNYAWRFPDEAMLVAKRQAQFEEEIREAEQAFDKSSPVSDQER